MRVLFVLTYVHSFPTSARHSRIPSLYLFHKMHIVPFVVYISMVRHINSIIFNPNKTNEHRQSYPYFKISFRNSGLGVHNHPPALRCPSQPISAQRSGI